MVIVVGAVFYMPRATNVTKRRMRLASLRLDFYLIGAARGVNSAIVRSALRRPQLLVAARLFIETPKADIA